MSERLLPPAARDEAAPCPHTAACSKRDQPDGHTVATMEDRATDLTEMTGVSAAADAGLDRAELAAVLAGLRLLQSALVVPASINVIMTDGGDVEPLSLGRIDALCERINCDGIEA